MRLSAIKFNIKLEDIMRVNVYPTYDSVNEIEIKDKIAVVVDIFRATSTMVTSFNNGCREVIPVVEIEEAMEISKNYEEGAYLLAGERNALKIEGFHLSNSPAEYRREVVEDKCIIFTTTNGTKAIRNAESAKGIVLGAFLNAQAISDYIISKGEDVALICAGTGGKFSLDDILGAGAIIYRLSNSKKELELDDLAIVCKYMYSQHRDSIDTIMSQARHYNVLKSTKHYRDIEYCLKEDIISVVPEYEDGIFTVKSDKSKE